ncbi:hypothetical protein KY290_025490 [Solanum tuberosum]|uniref:Uncharacterized protein n=1 Tax=Solanum tuberosum TaxID=4113 RepID=A0ABQ7UTQ4_SOLTU|nr:hypothetical protein KY290_025490 [Solanum tuberosum]
MENWTTIQHCTISTWDQHLDWMIANSKGHSQGAQVFRMVYSETIYAIWMERNFCIFEKRGREWESIAKEIAYVSCVRAPPKIRCTVQDFKF